MGLPPTHRDKNGQLWKNALFRRKVLCRMTEVIQTGPESLLDAIRKRPAMFLDNQPSLSALRGFLAGYDMARSSYTGGTGLGPLPQDFGEWVAYRLGFYSSCMGWRNMILDRVPDESEALKRFFELLDEYRNRKPRLIATVNGYASRQRAPQILLPDSTQSEREWSDVRPATLTLISYTDNPGFFVGSDEETKFFWRDHFFPTLKFFASQLGVSKENLTILEPEIYARWLTQERRFDDPSTSEG